MKPFTAIAVTALAAVMATSCATMGIGSYVSRGTDFTAYRTYDWGPADALPTGDPRLDANGIFVDHFVGAVEKAMAARGFERAAPGATPDLLLHFHASITERLVVNDYRGLGDCALNECGPRPEVFEAGTLLLDAMDARTAQLVWRGWAEDGIAGALAHQDRLEEFVNEAVAGMMRHFPVAVRNSFPARS
jgi:hypothetical protein